MKAYLLYLRDCALATTLQKETKKSAFHPPGLSDYEIQDRYRGARHNTGWWQKTRGGVGWPKASAGRFTQPDL